MGPPESGRRPVSHASRIRPATWAAVTVLLLASLVGMLWVPSYARITPTLGGFPFFYWYQLLWVPIVAILSWLAYLLITPRRAAGGRHGDRDTGREEGK